MLQENEKTAKIDALDLNHVRDYLAEKAGWSKDYATQVENDYRGFLKLYAVNPQGRFVSTRHVDDFWHAHILHVGKYVKDCQETFGYLLDHLPVVEEGADLTIYHELYEQTQNAFKENFGHEMGVNSNPDQSICYGDSPRKNAICYGDSPLNSICYGNSPYTAVNEIFSRAEKMAMA